MRITLIAWELAVWSGLPLLEWTAEHLGNFLCSAGLQVIGAHVKTKSIGGSDFTAHLETLRTAVPPLDASLKEEASFAHCVFTDRFVQLLSSSRPTKENSAMDLDEARKQGLDVSSIRNLAVGDNLDGGKDEEAWHAFNILIFKFNLYFEHLSDVVPEAGSPKDASAYRPDEVDRAFKKMIMMAQAIRILCVEVPELRELNKEGHFPASSEFRLRRSFEKKNKRVAADFLTLNQSDNAEQHQILKYINHILGTADLAKEGRGFPQDDNGNAAALEDDLDTAVHSRPSKLGKRAINGGDWVYPSLPFCRLLVVCISCCLLFWFFYVKIRSTTIKSPSPPENGSRVLKVRELLQTRRHIHTNYPNVLSCSLHLGHAQAALGSSL